MEYTACTRSTADKSLPSLAIRDEDNKPGRKSPTSPPASSKKAKRAVAVTGFKCIYCPAMLASPRGRGGHQKVHSHLRQVRQKQTQKKQRRLGPAARQVRVSSTLSNVPSSARSGIVPSVASRGGGHVGSGDQLRQVNKEETARYFSWLLSSAVPLFVSQTGTGTSGLAQSSFASPALAAAGGNGGTGDGVHIGRQQDMPEVNQEETTDGIDLTLRL